MKHIFKKLHHQPNRANELPQQPAQPPPQTPAFPSTSDNRTISSSPSTASTNPARGEGSATVTDFTSESNRLQQHHQQDYYSSEEEYQVQLALALSVSSSVQTSGLTDRENALIRATGGTDNGYTAADLLSRRYWNYGVLDFEERVVDGFYDVYNISPDPETRENMPSLSDLESNNGCSDYEVVIVSRKLDPALEELMQIAHCIMLDCPMTEIALLIKRLAELVTQHMGGSVRDANLILAKWSERSTELRTSLHTIVLPIGSLKVGLLRHRALLFKTLADRVGLPCRLVKGSHYTGVEDDAVNIIKLLDDSECLVDLMGDPGTLIPTDVIVKDTPVNLYNPRQSKFLGIQTMKDIKVSSKNFDHKLKGEHDFYLDDAYLKPKTSLSLLDASTENRAGLDELNDKVPSANQLDRNSQRTIGSAFHDGGFMTNSAFAGSKMNLNPVPFSEKNVEISKYFFADLNPFKLEGSDKYKVKDSLGNGIDKHQILDNNFVSSQLPETLLQKSHYARNELSKRNEDGTFEGLLVNTQRDNNTNVPSLCRNSNVQPNASELFEKPRNSYGSKDDCSLFSMSSKTASDESELNQLSDEVDKETYLLKNEEVKQRREPKIKDHNQNFIIQKDYCENMRDRLSGANMKLKETEVSSSVDTGSRYVGTVIDEVGECEIQWENLVIFERIGLGSYGEVYRADWNDAEVAVKKFLDQDFSGAALDEFKREVRIMRRLRHPNVVLFMGAVTRPPNLSIVTEFLPRGSLYRIIHRPHCQIDEKRRIKMALDVAKGMNCLHASLPTIVHRDLKSHNLLVDNNWNVKVCDFGLSRLKHNTFLSSKSTAGTPEWMAPEVLRNEQSNEKCDVYSFGVILWELATLKLPWNEMNPIQVVGAVGFQNRRLEIPKDVDPLVSSIICECWQTDPNLRPSFAQLTVKLRQLQRLMIPSHVEHLAVPLPLQNS